MLQEIPWEPSPRQLKKMQSCLKHSINAAQNTKCQGESRAGKILSVFRTISVLKIQITFPFTIYISEFCKPIDSHTVCITVELSD